MASVLIKSIEKGVAVESLIPKIKALKKVSFRKLLDHLSNLYYNKTPAVTDSEFDLIESIYESLYGKNTKVGSQPSGVTLEKVKLPYHMGSLDKIREDKPLANWKKKWTGKFVVSDKLDGVSVCVQYINGNIKLYKRGDDQQGTDISHLAQYLDIPQLKEDIFSSSGGKNNIASAAGGSRNMASSSGGLNNITITIRGELILPIKTFNDKYAATMKNPRNTISGLTNSKNFDPDNIRDIHLVAYQIYGTDAPQSEQFRMLQNLGFNVARYMVMDGDDLTVQNLTDEVKFRKSRSQYEMDGLVICADLKAEYPSSGNPKHAIAFKISGDTCVTTVLGVEWNVSKHGLLKPRVKVEPVQLNGVTIEYASGFNAKFIKENGVGPGAKIVITRSGDVIPDILEVIQGVAPALPDCNYQWNESGVEIITTNFDDNRELNIKRIETFFKELGAKYLAETTIAKLYDSGLDTLKKFLNATVEDISKVEGFKDKSAERIVQSIQDSIRDVPIYRVMAASNLFPNFGAKRLKTIVQEIGDWDMLSPKELKERINSIKGFKTLAEVFVSNIDGFRDFLNTHPDIRINNNEEQYTGVKALVGMTIVFSGLRGYETEVERNGGKVGSAVSSQTSFLVVKSLDTNTTKEQKAKSLGIPIILLEEFKAKYLC